MVGKNSQVAVPKLLVALVACLVVVVLCLVFTKVRPSGGTIYVHVTTFPAVVEIDGQERQVKSLLESPAVFHLPPGQHLLRVRQGNKVLDEYLFNLANGEEQVLTIPRHRVDPP